MTQLIREFFVVCLFKKKKKKKKKDRRFNKGFAGSTCPYFVWVYEKSSNICVTLLGAFYIFPDDMSIFFVFMCFILKWCFD